MEQATLGSLGHVSHAKYNRSGIVNKQVIWRNNRKMVHHLPSPESSSGKGPGALSTAETSASLPAETPPTPGHASASSIFSAVGSHCPLE